MKAGILVTNSRPGPLHCWGLSKWRGRLIIVLLLQGRMDDQEGLTIVAWLVWTAQTMSMWWACLGHPGTFRNLRPTPSTEKKEWDPGSLLAEIQPPPTHHSFCRLCLNPTNLPALP